MIYIYDDNNDDGIDNKFYHVVVYYENTNQYDINDIDEGDVKDDNDKDENDIDNSNFDDDDDKDDDNEDDVDFLRSRIKN